MKIKQAILYLYHLRRWLLFCGLIGSTLLNVYLFQVAHQYYLALNGTRLDPLGLLYPTRAGISTPITNTAPSRVVFFGDSRAQQWPTPSRGKQFVFINRGIGAQTSVQVAARFEQDVVPLHPQIVLIQVGINDLKTIPLFPARQEQIIQHCKENIQKSVAQARRLGATVILTTIFPAGYIPLPRRIFWSSAVPLAVEEVNTFIRSLQGPGVILFDTAILLTGDNGKANITYYQDTLHLNAQGYALLNQKLLTILSK